MADVDNSRASQVAKQQPNRGIVVADNVLFYGDNLEILREHIDEESVDLVYLDPPFKSDQDYNVLFSERDGTGAAAQIRAFQDTWTWDVNAARAWTECVEEGGKVSDALQALRKFLGTSDMLAYLSMMAPRLKELRKAMKPTGSIYLHCDPSASHYLKMIMDAVFTPGCFRNEIIWRRTGAHNKLHRYGPIHDSLLFYTKSDTFTWNNPKRPYMKGHIKEYFEKDDKGYKTAYYGNVLTGSGTRGGESGKPWKGFDPTAKGRHWAVPGAVVADLLEIGVSLEGMTQHQKLDKMLELGCIQIIKGQAWPMYERYLTENDGQAVQDIWAYQPYTEGTVFGTEEGIDADVRWLSPRDQERLGYPTQKPEGLLERLIAASSDKGGVVLDPFCGCGTTITAAQKLDRHWIGIDVTHLAIGLIRHRLRDSFGDGIEYEVIGEPQSVEDAQALAEQDRYQFQWWALGLVGARMDERKKGADRGIDGRLFFHDEAEGGATKTIIISVKSGGVSSPHIRDLVGVIKREEAEIGVVITLEKPTKAMITEAASAGFYESPWTRKGHPRIQILTIEELLDGRKIDMPPIRQTNVTFRKAKKHKRKSDLKEGKLKFEE